MSVTENTSGRPETIPAAEQAGGDGFQPIESYAAIGDCRTAALVSRRGSIDFLCWPRFDSPAVFAALLDNDRGGRFAITPSQPFDSSRHYLPASNVLVTEFRTSSGAARLTDAFFAADEKTKGRDFLPASMLMRRIEVTEGDVAFDMLCEPTTGFGLSRPRCRRWDARSFTFQARDALVHLGLSFDAELSDGSISSRLVMREGDSHVAVLSLNELGPAVFPPLARIDEFFETTDAFWRDWSSCITYRGPYRDAVTRSALALKLLCFAPSGAIVAAPTTSLPEKIGASYNWDYRFCWLRDASLTVRGLVGVGLEDEAQAYLQWLLHATWLTHPELQVVYNVFGKTRLKESTLDHLSGYRGSRPVRIGNDAHNQKQLDVYGEVASAVTICLAPGVDLSGDERAFLKGILRFVMKQWQEPDAGIWETRREPRHHIHSKVMCWVALQSGIRLANEGLIDVDVEELRQTADSIKREVQERGFSEELGTYTAAYGSVDLDASVLTLPIVGFEDASSPKMQQTIDTIRRVLARDELVFRHQNSETGGEGAFLLCSFWLVECLALQGSLEEAKDIFERLLLLMNDVGLYAEEADPHDRSFLGNFPQAFTHVGLINAALTISAAEQEGAEST